MLRNFFFFLFLFSCSSPVLKKKTAVPDAEKENLSFKELQDTVVPFAGFWVNKKYIAELQKTRSPHKALEFAGQSCIQIPGRTLNITRMVNSFHDGGADIALVHSKNGYFLRLVSNDSTYGTAIPLSVVNERTMRIERDTFEKVDCVIHEDEEPMLLQKLLFAGNYISDDGKEIRLMEDGKVNGIDSIKYYGPLIDYNWPGAPDVDAIYWGTDRSKVHQFAFQFKDDSLKFFEMECVGFDSVNLECEKTVLGKHLFDLIRKK
jgi:hypothetical protein